MAIGRRASPAVYLNATARPAHAPASARSMRVLRSYALTANAIDSATPSSEPTSVSAIREYATGRKANASTAAATSPSRTPQRRRAAQ
jgi:hypothetical protein